MIKLTTRQKLTRDLYHLKYNNTRSNTTEESFHNLKEDSQYKPNQTWKTSTKKAK